MRVRAVVVVVMMRVRVMALGWRGTAGGPRTGSAASGQWGEGDEGGEDGDEDGDEGEGDEGQGDDDDDDHTVRVLSGTAGGRRTGSAASGPWSS